MLQIFHWLQDQLQHNQFFSGAAGFSIIGGALYWLRSIPTMLWTKIVWMTTTTVIFTNDNEAFDQTLVWIGPKMQRWYHRHFKVVDLPRGRSSRNSPITRRDSDGVSGVDWMMTIGYGEFWLFWNSRSYRVEYSMDEKVHAQGKEVRETLKITSIFSGRSGIRALLDAARMDQLVIQTISIYLWSDSYWSKIDSRRPRPINTVMLRDGMAEDIIHDIQRFGESFNQYQNRGVPWRRGYLFCGPPGTGKSSTVFALASHFKVPVYAINLASIRGDADLHDALSEVPSSGFVLIEDIDATDATASREETDDKKGESRVSLSGLLNAIDGVIAKEGRILFMTTNYPEKLDSALVRPGRIDRRWEFGLADAAQATRMIAKFFPESDIPRITHCAGLSAADIQGICQNSEGDLDAVIEAINRRTERQDLEVAA